MLAATSRGWPKLGLAAGRRHGSHSRRRTATGIVRDATRATTTIVTSTDHWVALLGW